MARLLNGSSQYLRVSNAPVTAAPFTINVWFKPDISHQGCVAIIGNSGNFQSFLVELLNTDVMRYVVNDGGFSLTTVGTVTIGQWNMVTVREAASNDHRVKLNAAGEQTFGNPRTPSVNQFALGARWRSDIGVYFDGEISHCAIWNDVLSDNEISSLYAGGVVTPARDVRPNKLISYWPLFDNDSDRDQWGTNHLTPIGTPTYAQQPPLVETIWPRSTLLFPIAAGGGGQTVQITGATETDTAGTVKSQKSAEITGSTESDTAGTVTPLLSKVISVTGATESDAAGTVKSQKSVEITGATETDASGTVSPLLSTVVQIVGASETDTAGVVVYPKTIAVTGATETDLAGTVNPVIPTTFVNIPGGRIAVLPGRTAPCIGGQ